MVYDQFEKDGRLTSKNWADYNMANLVFRPERVTTEVLEKMVKKAWLEFYSMNSVVHRLGLSFRKIRLFIWLLNLVLCYYTRKKIK
jgi:hypothetical protein